MSFARLEQAAWTDPRVAAAYDEGFGPIVAGAIGPLLAAAGVGAGDALVDLACGPGGVAAEAARRGARVTLLDFSRAMLERARPRHPDGTFVAASAERLPLRDGTVDRMVCNFGLLHLPRPDEALAEAARVLRPGGRAAWSVWAATSEAMQLIPRALADLGLAPDLPPGPPFFRFAGPGEFERSIAATGLTALPAQTVRWTFALPGPTAFLRAFGDGTARTRASLLALSSEDRTRVERRIRERLEPFRHGAELRVPTAAVIGAAVRPVG